MKFSLRGLLIGSLGAAALSLSPLPVSPAHAFPLSEVTLDGHRVQILHTGGVNTDSTNFNITFTNHGEWHLFDCDGGDDNATSGIEVALSPLSCEPVCDGNAVCMDSPNPVIFPFDYDFEPFVIHIVNHATYGTFFG